ncbi:MAG: hypothetical protein WDZ38_07070 [Balneolaceae bacterium]
MQKRSERIDKLSDAIDRWLQPDNSELKEAIDLTVSEKLFSLEDIKHRILSLKNTLTRENLIRWAELSKLNPESNQGKEIVCLHAGNLPMVGIQDLLATILTGAKYVGKLSKKDPYLLPTLISKLKISDVADNPQWTVNIGQLRGIKAKAILFAGSGKSVQKVKSKLRSIGVANSNTPALIRTAHFSIAWIRDMEPETMVDLTEAVFRYGGRGCRSAAIVVAPEPLLSNSCSFTDYIESFWIKNPQFEKPEESLKHRFALNRAVGVPQLWLDHFLIEERFEQPDENFILYWIKGGESELKELIQKTQNGLQSVFTTGSYMDRQIEGFTLEPLSEAQNPPIWWRPDGVEPISWLQEHSND